MKLLKQDKNYKFYELRKTESAIINHIKHLYAKSPKCYQRDCQIDNLKIELENVQKDILDLL